MIIILFMQAAILSHVAQFRSTSGFFSSFVPINVPFNIDVLNIHFFSIFSTVAE